jgi:hypothetical protein
VSGSLRIPLTKDRFSLQQSHWQRCSQNRRFRSRFSSWIWPVYKGPTELVFTELILQILYWIYEMLFIVASLYWIYLPTNIDLWSTGIYYFFWRGIGLFLVGLTVVEKCGKAWRQLIYEGLWMPRKKEGNVQAEIYSLRNLCIITKYLLSVTTIDISYLDWA